MTLPPHLAPLGMRCPLAWTIGRPGGPAPLPGSEPVADVDDARLEGRAAHWLAARGMTANLAEFIGQQSPDGWVITDNMVNHIQGYVDFLEQISGGYYQVIAEEAVSSVHYGIAGRLDGMVVDAGTDGGVTIVSLKYGYRIVEPEWNAQLLAELACVWQDHHTVARLVVYQPRPSHPAGIVREWVLDHEGVAAALRWLYLGTRLALAPEPPAEPGAHCLDCAGARICRAVTDAAYAISDIVHTRGTVGLTDEQLGAELDFLTDAADTVEARRSAVAAEADARIRAGRIIPGWWRDNPPGGTRRVLTVPALAVGIFTGVSPFRTVELTPPELEKAGAKPADVKLISETPQPKARLVRATARRINQLFKDVK